ncbi:MAG: GTPase HflX [Phycisphaerales bacterium]|nr:GTPase HflX [Phycisphaerales bacterium]
MSQIQREQLKVARERAVLVSVRLPRDEVDLETRLAELAALARTADAEVVGVLTQSRRLPSGKTFIGRGKIEELTRFIESEKATLVLFDHELSPGQIRNLERATSSKIIDRSELILDIFARRATTHAAKLQVEIAQLQYTYPRLRAMWDHLGQVTGGAPIGIGTRGPGEKQLEIDRRLVKRRLRQLRNELETIQQRKVREVLARNEDHFTVGLVGYTNVGKSTIFNQLTEGGAFANDKLFATLSTRVERWDLGGGNNVMLSDTVGFIRQLPHHLVASFRSTLEETVNCQLLLNLVDVSDPNARSQARSVDRTLDQIGAVDQPRIVLLNKIDQLEHRDLLLPWLRDYPQAIPVSATTGEGLDVLAETVRTMFVGPIATVRLTVDLSEGAIVDFIEKRTVVEDREYGDGVVIYTTALGRRQLDQLLARSTRILIDDRDASEVAREARGGGWGDRLSCPMPPHRLQAPEA